MMREAGGDDSIDPPRLSHALDLHHFNCGGIAPLSNEVGAELLRDSAGGDRTGPAPLAGPRRGVSRNRDRSRDDGSHPRRRSGRDCLHDAVLDGDQYRDRRSGLGSGAGGDRHRSGAPGPADPAHECGQAARAGGASHPVVARSGADAERFPAGPQPENAPGGGQPRHDR